MGTHVRSFPVEGMTCASCVRSVEKALRAVPGVGDVSVNLADRSALVAWSGGQVTEEALQAAVRKAGYALLVTAPDELPGGNDRSLALRRRMVWAMALTVPVVLAGMLFMDAWWSRWTQALFTALVVLVFGRSFFVTAWRQASHGTAGMDTLVALGTGVTFVHGVFTTLAPGFWRERGLEPHVYFEAAAVIIAFVLLGRYLEERARSGAGDAVRKLMGLRPDKALREDPDGVPVEVDVASLNVGDVLLVRAGERIAVDGEVLDGAGHVDESMLSGEPMPVAKEPGSRLYAGTINQQGSLRMKAVQVGAATVLARIVHAVRVAQGSRAPVQRLVDRVAAVFVPVIIGIALLSAATWWALGGDDAFTHGLMALVAVLVVACPCALGLATPTAIIAGVGRAAGLGILVRDAESLERAQGITAVVVDKTGTLTEGRPSVVDAVGLDEAGSAAALLALERRSEHPLARAITTHLQRGAAASVAAFEVHPGKGVSGEVNGVRWLAGSRRCMEEGGVMIGMEWRAHELRWQEAAHTVVWLSDGQRVRAAVAIADRIRPSAARAIARLRSQGIAVYMQTGDSLRSARAVAREVGIEDVRSDVLPPEKAAFVKGLQQQGRVVAMVGDGINDSEALACADVGIAMGQGSDIAIDVARMTLVNGDLDGLPKAIALSRRTMAVVRQNLFWAFLYNLLGVPIAAGVLVPVNGFQLDPMVAGAAMALSSVSVVVNSLRLRTMRLG